MRINGGLATAISLYLSLLTPYAVSAAATPGGSLQARQATIPGPPSDPPLPAGDGAGPYKSEDASLGDRAKKVQFQAMAAAADTLGLDNAANNLNHYLDNTGKDFTNSPDAIMKDIASFKQAVNALATQHAKDAFKAGRTESGATKTFVSPWTSFYATKELSKDWFFALGGFSYAVAGTVATKKSGTAWTSSLSYKVYLFDRYNWDTGKGVTIGPFEFKDTELGRMHIVGLAREYIVRGTSKEYTVNPYTGATVPMPDTPGEQRD